MDAELREPSRVFSGRELVLIAEIPKASGRWRQAHFNADSMASFFRAASQGQRELDLEYVNPRAEIARAPRANVVFSEVNKNYKVELEFDQFDAEYPADGPPLFIGVELGVRHCRYVTLHPNDDGYAPVRAFARSLPKLGKGNHRALTTLNEVEMRWPQCPLRFAVPAAKPDRTTPPMF